MDDQVQVKHMHCQSLMEQSEVTIQDFKSEYSDDEVWQQLLNKYTMEDRRHLIIDRSKKTIIDMRNEENIENLFKKNPKQEIVAKQISTESVKTGNVVSWEDHWEESDRMHQKLLRSICTNDLETFTSFLLNKETNFPINVNFKSFDDWAPIHYIAMHGRQEMLKMIFENHNLNLNALTKFGWNALHVGVNSNKVVICNLLIEKGIEVNEQDKDRNSPLHYASQFGYSQIMKNLIENGSDLTLKNHNGYTPKQLCSIKQLFDLFPLGQKNEPKEGFFRGFFRNKNVQYVQKILNKKQEKVDVSLKDLKDLDFKKRTSKQSNRQTNIVKMYALLKSNHEEVISLASFKFYKKIGEGAFGEVYVVRKGKSQKCYALKAIKKQKVLKTNLYKYIQTEKEVLSLICHPFIVRLHFAFQTQTYLFLVMEYCEGGDLGKLLERKKKLDETTTKAYASQLLLAMEALHKNMIIYRDLKPQNIVLDRDGHALLTDFGLSKKTRDLDEIQRSFCGTPAYLPLQIIDKKGHTRMVDWYEYGVVLYEMMIGIPPFYADTRSQLFKNIRQGFIKFPKNTSEKFKDLIRQLLHQDPKKRLGAERDAESIKQHPWFQDVDWEQVYERKLPVPPIQKKTLIPTDPIKCKFIDLKSQKFEIPAWSFISP